MRTRQIAEGEVVHRLQTSRIRRVEDGEAIGEHVPDVHMPPVDHHLHRIRPPALVAVRDMADAPADALRRNVRFALRASRERHAGKRRETGDGLQISATTRHLSSRNEAP